MEKGKRTCNVLRQIRQQVADANDISYVPTPCTHKGDCLGTCPACEAEVRYIERELNARRLLGKAVVVAGLSLGLSTLPGCSQDVLSSDTLPQKPESANLTDKVGLMPIEKFPEFPGGRSKLIEFLAANTTYPKECEDSSIEGRVVVSFVVEKDGSLTDIKTVKKVHPLLDAEAVRVISLMPKWIPGGEKGHEMRIKYNVPITFRMRKEQPKDSVDVVK